ncbi:chitin synthase-domain-containing protein [Chytridium lagenaria]|nr:chitin synthase-domain-containing protein [Chytridium lagenaria]
MLVTCYSEGEEGIRNTLSLLRLLFVIADGLITGYGNSIMISQDESLPGPDSKSYHAISDGAKQHNMAKVKAGNRGKRDSQLILMNFLSRIQMITGVNPDVYTLVLMVDADTKVAPDSLKYMVQAMKNDPTIMGLCGETRIANKRTSWVTAIQVFEYYISHHLGKPLNQYLGTFVVPILANPDIVDEYSENIVDTLHKKNLLLLGEDRFLTTLMRGPICRTVVPDTFKMLLSQRRRWINSTIHNLLELVLLRDLCGIFCFSMQFIVMVATLPLLMLLATLGLPGVLIVITTRKWYIWWDVWNFVLPIYAFWHFDDFTWGETRKVEGEAEQHDHSTRTGQYEIGAVVLKT